jgi:hypothetical protein
VDIIEIGVEPGAPAMRPTHTQTLAGGKTIRARGGKKGTNNAGQPERKQSKRNGRFGSLALENRARGTAGLDP